MSDTPVDLEGFTAIHNHGSSEVGAAVAALEQREFVKTEPLNLEDRNEVLLVTTPVTAVRHLVDLEALRAVPRRRHGTVKVYSADSFVELYNQLVGAEGERARVYADEDQGALVAVLNDDGIEPGWRDHRIELALRPTPEWTHWTSHQGLHDQQYFAEAIEDGLKEIRVPSAAEMLELAQNFQASVGVKFKQGGRLADGRRQFTFEEDIQASAGEAGQITIPGEFVLEITPFVGGGPVTMTARFRYRLPQGGGSLQIGYVLERPHEAEAEAFVAIRNAVAAVLGPAIDGVAPQAHTPNGHVSRTL